MANRTFPNDNFAWYNDDKRVAIVAIDSTTSTSESTKEPYDTYQEADVTRGLRISYHSKYEIVATSNLTGDMSATFGVDTGLHECVLCYIKARLFEDQGDMQKAQYFRMMYEKKLKQYPSRKSGIRQLAVSRL